MKYKKQSNYKTLRRRAYPNLEEQLDAMWDVISVLLTKTKFDRLEPESQDLINKIVRVRRRFKRKNK